MLGRVKFIITSKLVKKFCRDIELESLNLSFLPEEQIDEDEELLRNFLVSLIAILLSINQFNKFLYRSQLIGMVKQNL